jgi:hypothetical protein
MTVSLLDLVTVQTQPQALASELQIATTIGLPVTAWQTVGIALSILETNAQIASNFSGTIAIIAQGGYASYAALMVDPTGVPITTWMDLISLDNYNNTRIPAVFAAVDSTGFSVTNSSGTTPPTFQIGQLIVSNPTTGAQYANTAAATLTAGMTTPVAIAALVAGAASTCGTNAITNIVKPILGCSCTNSKALVGFDAETNAALLRRDKAKLGALSPNGPSQAYYFVATSILDPTQRFYNAALSSPITRVLTLSSPARVDVYVANASPPVAGTVGPDTGDLGIVDAAIQAWCVPLGTTAIVHAAVQVTINITYTVYVPTASGLSAANVKSQISAALATYFAGLPIGGVTGATTNIVPWSELIAVIGRAVPQANAIALPTPTGDTPIGTTQVPKLGTITATVTFV